MQKTLKNLFILSALALSTPVISKSVISTSVIGATGYANDGLITDQSRNRTIPINITLPSNNAKCTEQVKCPVAFINAGYGISHNGYTFASNAFNQRGY